jgi:hypothetical protein
MDFVVIPVSDLHKRDSKNVKSHEKQGPDYWIPQYIKAKQRVNTPEDTLLSIDMSAEKFCLIGRILETIMYSITSI